MQVFKIDLLIALYRLLSKIEGNLGDCFHQNDVQDENALPISLKRCRLSGMIHYHIL